MVYNFALQLSNGCYILHAYGDIDWALDIDDHRSTSDSLYFFRPNLVS